MRYLLALLLTIMVAAGCASIPNPFTHGKADFSALPADAVREVADEIEQAVQKGDRDAKLTDRPGVVVNDAAIQQAVRTRAARAELVGELLNAGHAYEDRNGLLTILRSKAYSKATTSKDRDRNALLVMGENTDRWAIYEGLVKTNKMGSRALPAVQDLFFKARVARMPKGQKYKDAEGKIVANVP